MCASGECVIGASQKGVMGECVSGEPASGKLCPIKTFLNTEQALSSVCGKCGKCEVHDSGTRMAITWPIAPHDTCMHT